MVLDYDWLLGGLLWYGWVVQLPISTRMHTRPEKERLNGLQVIWLLVILKKLMERLLSPVPI